MLYLNGGLPAESNPQKQKWAPSIKIQLSTSHCGTGEPEINSPPFKRYEKEITFEPKRSVGVDSDLNRTEELPAQINTGKRPLRCILILCLLHILQISSNENFQPLAYYQI